MKSVLHFTVCPYHHPWKTGKRYKATPRHLQAPQKQDSEQDCGRKYDSVLAPSSHLWTTITASPWYPAKILSLFDWDSKEKEIPRISVHKQKIQTNKTKTKIKTHTTFPAFPPFLSLHLSIWVIALSVFPSFPCTHSPYFSCYIHSIISNHNYFSKIQKKMKSRPCDTHSRLD